MTGTTWDGGRAVIAIVPGMTPMFSLAMICAVGSCPVLNVSCCPPPAARCQPTNTGGVPSDGGIPPYVPGGPVGTPGETPMPCHAAQAAPGENGAANGPLAVAATARDCTVRLAVGANAGFAGSNGGRT